MVCVKAVISSANMKSQCPSSGKMTCAPLNRAWKSLGVV